MSEQRILQDIAPPSGGWDRLVARRDALRPGQGLGLPLATAAVLGLVVFLLRPQETELQLPWDGARLQAHRSEGLGLQRVGGAQATAIESSDPRVQFYWVQPVGAH